MVTVLVGYKNPFINSGLTSIFSRAKVSLFAVTPQSINIPPCPQPKNIEFPLLEEKSGENLDK